MDMKVKTEHAELLNALCDMQASPAYAVRKQVLAQAEALILELEKNSNRYLGIRSLACTGGEGDFDIMQEVVERIIPEDREDRPSVSEFDTIVDQVLAAVEAKGKKP